MHKLSHVEAQRVIGVLGETLERLSCLASVPRRPNSQLFLALEEARAGQVIAQLETLYQLEEAMAVEHEKASHKDTASVLEKKHRVNTRALCRALREDSQAVRVLKQFEAIGVHESVHEQKDDEAKLDESGLIDEDALAPAVLNDLHESLGGLQDVVFRALTTTVEDEAAQKQLYQTVSTREKEAEEDRQTLEHQLAMSRRNRRRVITELDAKLSKLRSELRDIKQTSASEESALTVQKQERSSAIETNHSGRMNGLVANESKLLEEMAAMQDEMEQAEQQMQKKKNKFEGEVNTLVSRYDQDMLEKQRAIDELRDTYEAEKKRLGELEEFFAKVDQENERIAKEEEEWSKYLEEKHKEERIYDDGAAALQKLYRGWKGRVEFDAIAKKSRKGKKGKK
mmetsp:Transcript_19837/g.50114  ORF Transcript_19837/g.50114 Transcript_19837/m.50114 type:complete len:398 (+) Transcript_19837:210-1403(+)